MKKNLILLAALALMPLMSFAQISDTEDRPEQLVIDGLRITVTEGGDAHVDVALAQQPGADVTVKVRSSNYSRLYISDGAALFFTPDNWQTAQTAYIKAIDDNICEGDETIDITIFSTSKDKQFNECKAIRQIRLKDNDKAGLSLTPNPLEINKQQKTGSVFVKLLAQPTADVKVVVRSTDSNVTLTDNVLTFTSVNWSAVQKVGVAINDRVTGTAPISLIASTRSESEAYNGISTSGALRIAGVEITETAEPIVVDHSDDGDVDDLFDETPAKGKDKKAKADKNKSQKADKGDKGQKQDPMTAVDRKPQKQKSPEQLKKEKEKQKAAAKKAAEKKKKEAAKKKAAQKKAAQKKKAAAQKKKK